MRLMSGDHTPAESVRRGTLYGVDYEHFDRPTRWFQLQAQLLLYRCKDRGGVRIGSGDSGRQRERNPTPYVQLIALRVLLSQLFTLLTSFTEYRIGAYHPRLACPYPEGPDGNH
jgi:hypothetical protein